MKLKDLIRYPFKQVLIFFEIASKAFVLVFLRKRKMVFLFGSPGHSNLGDHAQTYCIKRWCKINFPEHQMFIFRLSFSKDILINLLRKIIHSKDILIFHSGYHLTDLYNEKLPYCRVAELFPDFPVTVFPQTIKFSCEGEANKVALTFNAHPNLTLMCRDEISYETAKKLFTKCKLLLYPDIVTSLIGTRHFFYKRSGVLFCMRNDKESFYKPGEISALRERFSSEETMMWDTTIPVSSRVIIANRETFLEKTFEQISKYKVVITDRYHGTIFSLISGTPVIVLKSTDHKLSSGVKWFPSDIFGDYIAFAEDLDSAYMLVQERLENPPTSTLPPYFKEQYYDVLLNELPIGEINQ